MTEKLPEEIPPEEIPPDETKQGEPEAKEPEAEKQTAAAPVAAPEEKLIPDDTPAWAKKLLADVDELRKGRADDATKNSQRKVRRESFRSAEAKAKQERADRERAKRSGARLFPDR